MKQNYSEQFKDPRWQKKRLEVLERDNWKCQMCSATEKTLHVHHHLYIKGRKIWEYDNRMLVSLCEECHAEISTHGFIADGSGNSFNECIEAVLISNNMSFEDLCFHLEYSWMHPEIFNIIDRVSHALFNQLLIKESSKKNKKDKFGNIRL